MTKATRLDVREKQIEITDDFVKFVDLLLKIDKRLQEQKRMETFS